MRHCPNQTYIHPREYFPAISIMTRINHPQRTLKSHLGPLTRGPDASVGFTTRDSCLTQAGCQFESCQTSNGHLNVARNEATGRPRSGPWIPFEGLATEISPAGRKKTDPHGRTYPRSAHFLRREKERERERELWNESVQGRRLNSDGRNREARDAY